MSIAHRTGMNAQPIACGSCGRDIALPQRHEALLDERGWAHVPCDCGAVNRVPFETVEPEQDRKRRRASWQFVALWLVIIGLVVLLFPMIQRQTEPDPPPPSYLTT